MKVHITCTPEYPEEHLDEIITLLKESPGEIKFEKGELWDRSQFSIFDSRFENIKNITSLTFEEYFTLINKYRIILKIPNDEFVILISTIKNSKNWFSAFHYKDIFIHGADWDSYSEVDAKYGIAFQCVENIFQSLIELDIDNYEDEPNIHLESTGCINDFCKKKIEVIYKLRNADICESCVDRALNKAINPNILEHISEITEKIRHQFVSKRKFRSEMNPKNVEINEQWQIKIGDKEFEPSAKLSKLLFIYFLTNPDGIQTPELCAKKDDFLKIYKAINTRAHDYTVKRLCCDDKKIAPKTFRTYKSRLKKELIQLLGNELAKHYIIQSEEIEHNNFRYKINLEHEYTKIKPLFNNQ